VLAVGRLLRTGDAPAQGAELDRGGPATLAGLLLAFGHTSWSYATVTEVYALTTLALVALLGLALAARRSEGGRLVRARRRARPGDRHPSRHDRAAAAVAGRARLGAAAQARPPLRGGAGRDRGRLRGRRLSVPALGRGARRVPGLGRPADAGALLVAPVGPPVPGVPHAVRGERPRRGGGTAAGLFREFGPPWFPAALALSVYGFVRLFRRDRALFAALVLLFGLDAVYALSYTIAEDKDAYYLPAVVALAVAAGAGAAALLARVTRNAPLWAAALFAIPLVAVLHHRAALDRSRFWVATTTPATRSRAWHRTACC
jgi:hypothetical protein